MKWFYILTTLIVLILVTAVITIYFFDSASVTRYGQDNGVMLSESVDTHSITYQETEPASISESAPLQTGAEPGSPRWLYILLVALVIANIISILISFWLYRWRKILLSTPALVLPEELGHHLEGLNSKQGKLYDMYKRGIEGLAGRTKNILQEEANTQQIIMTLQKAIDQRDQELTRYREGYDMWMYKKYLRRFVKVYQVIAEQVKERNQDHNLMMLEKLMWDALAECGVDEYNPKIGDDYRKYSNEVSDDVVKLPTDDEQADFKIAEVLMPGYKVTTHAEVAVIVPAKISMYSLGGRGAN